ncbi:Omega-amidase nit3 [Rhizina undulata]
MLRRFITSALHKLFTAPTRSYSNVMTSPLRKQVKLALVQMATGNDKAQNLLHAREKAVEAANRGANVIVLPECFNSPYGTEHFQKYAEPVPTSSKPYTPEQTPSYHALSAIASETNTYLVGGSIPEVDPETKKLYNTALVFSPKGELLVTHRKVHLFDIDIPGKIRFIESEVLSPGESVTVVDLPEYGKIGLGICYDIRFPEIAMIAARKGAFALFYPGAFNMTTGPLHWELLARARAVDNQVYVAVCSPARGTEGYTAWGHSSVVDPNGAVVETTEEAEGIVEWTLEPDRIAEVRRGIPVTVQRRFDVYADVAREGPTEKK